MHEDQRQWERIRQRDGEAFGEFYRQNAGRLELFLRQAMGIHHAAEDIVQESFAQIWRRPDSFRPERASLRTYLYGIARKLAQEAWRGRRNEVPIADPLPQRDVSNTEYNSIVLDAFSRLCEPQRSILWLREVEGRSYVELAEVFAVPVGTVRSRLYTAREALRKIWFAPNEQRKESA